MPSFEWVAGAFGGVLSGIVLYLTKTVIEVPGKYVQKVDFNPEQFMLKTDCQRFSDQLHNENRQDHQLLFNEIKELRNEFVKSQAIILQEVKKQ